MDQSAQQCHKINSKSHTSSENQHELGHTFSLSCYHRNTEHNVGGELQRVYNSCMTEWWRQQSVLWNHVAQPFTDEFL